ncbi:transposase [Acinetobacter suaedae]|uniref:Transposase n=1 Tax=Acinetobacter suaedae TaxID=2609668 RepID=A0A5P1UY34_9GAMM|nr:putative type VI secretion system effector [Acinetobacter sp. C16S1]QER40086.1 transposase [Acinetobacter sp. C16S1]
MKVIYGIVQNLQFVDAIVSELPKLRTQARATALVSMFAESGGMGAAATLSGINGFPGYYIHFEIDGEAFYAAFTGVFFKEGEEVYVVYDEDIEQNFNVLAIMNKNNKLLGMAVPFGHTVAISDKAHNKNTLFMYVGINTLMALGLIFLGFDLFLFLSGLIIFAIIISFLGESIKKQFRGYAQESERIYKILGVKDIDALNKALIKNDPQPYEDKETDRIYEDVHDYTQFLDYDPQPLVDR